MQTEQVRVLLYASFPRDSRLEFSLIFADNYEKYYSFDEYAIRQYRSANEREVIEACAREYFEDLGQPIDFIKLIFL